MHFRFRCYRTPKKVFAYQNPTFKERMGAAAPMGGFAPPKPPAGYLDKEIAGEGQV